MGIFRQKVLISNAIDKGLVSRKMLKLEEVRQVEADFLVDTGAYMMCINEQIQNQLGLEVTDRMEAVLADGKLQMFNVVGPIEVKIHNRRTITEAFVLPGDATPLFGSIPLEALDLLVDPKTGTLIVPPDRPYVAQSILK